MNVLRPVRENDLEAIYELAGQTKTGLTTLPQDRDYLRERIEANVHHFAFPPQKPGGESFMFVLENIENHEVMGTSAVFTKVGGFEPFWTYELKTFINESEALGVSKEIEYLSLKKIHNGPSEIGTLFLSSHHRNGFNGRMLSLGRFMFMAMYPHCFEKKVLAELRGYMNGDGKSLFWRSLGKHFFDVPFEQADLMVNKDKSFISDLMPRHPIYIPLLPPEAQELIGRVHPDTIPAKKLLEQEGFQFQNEVDIFEAGPVLGCEVTNIRTVKAMRSVQLSNLAPVASNQGQASLLATGATPSEFSLTAADVCFDENGDLQLDESVAQALSVNVGDFLSVSPIKGQFKES